MTHTATDSEGNESTATQIVTVIEVIVTEILAQGTQAGTDIVKAFTEAPIGC